MIIHVAAKKRTEEVIAPLQKAIGEPAEVLWRVCLVIYCFSACSLSTRGESKIRVSDALWQKLCAT